MGYTISEPSRKAHRRTSSSSEKSASGDFFANPNKTHLENRSNSLKQCLGNPSTPTKNASALNNSVLWNSRRFDEQSGLYYYALRHYKADIGRWLGRDPVQESGGYNLYGFVGNSPTKWIDVFGLSKWFPNRTNFGNGVFDANYNRGQRMEVPSDGKTSVARYKELAKIRSEAATVLENKLEIAGYKGAQYAKQASQKGPRLGYAPYQKFPTSVEYAGRICCKDKQYMITGPYTTGGRFSVQTGGFPYMYKGDRYIPITRNSQYSSLPNYLQVLVLRAAGLNKLENKDSSITEEMKNKAQKEYDSKASHTGFPDSCPEGWNEVGGYHNHPIGSSSPSQPDINTARGGYEFISANRNNSVTMLTPSGTLSNANYYPINPDGTRAGNAR